MQNTNQLQKYLVRSALELAVAAETWLPGKERALEAGTTMKPMKGGEHLMMLNNPITTTEQANALTPDDSFAMVCAKCKTVYVTRVKQGTKGAQLLMGDAPSELIGTHACTGCGGTWTITGVGKGVKKEFKHTCTMCGEGSGFCCATKPGEGATKGMEEEKK